MLLQGSYPILQRERILNENVHRIEATIVDGEDELLGPRENHGVLVREERERHMHALEGALLPVLSVWRIDADSSNHRV